MARASRSSFLRTLAINGLVLLVLLCLVEGALRATGRVPGMGFNTVRYDNDPASGPKAMPSQVAFARSTCFDVQDIHFNNHGMRDRDRAFLKKGPRIALLGDSFTEGLQVPDEDTVARALEGRLERKTEVLNFGVSSTGTAVQLLHYRKYVRQFKPDVVLLLFFPGNDVADNLPELKRFQDPAMASRSPYLLLDDKGALQLTPGQVAQTSKVHVWIGKSVVAQWAYYGMVRARTRKARGALPEQQATAAGKDDKLDPTWEKAWKTTEALILRMRKEVEADGARFGVVILGGDHVALGRDGQIVDKAAVAVKRIGALQAEHKLAVLDLNAAFMKMRARHGAVDIAHACDGHWNTRGHKEAAIAIARFLTEQKWPW